MPIFANVNLAAMCGVGVVEGGPRPGECPKCIFCPEKKESLYLRISVFFGGGGGGEPTWRISIVDFPCAKPFSRAVVLHYAFSYFLLMSFVFLYLNFLVNIFLHLRVGDVNHFGECPTLRGASCARRNIF